MEYQKRLSSTFTNTKLRTPNDVCGLSGMCSTCSNECTGLCEIGLSAVRGSEAAYPYGTSDQQFASEKSYPFDYSHFNINGRVFGALGASEDAEKTNVFSADIGCEIGYDTKIRLKAPILLPAIAKLNWQDYYSGAAMAGIIAVIGESVIKNDRELKFNADGQVINAPIIQRMVECFRKYQNGYGEIVLQVNADDITVGVPEYAATHSDVKTLEIKFGQAAKGIQHVAPVSSYEEALWLKKSGYIVQPDPCDELIKKQFHEDFGLRFTQYGRLPMWNEEILQEKIQKYRSLGVKNILFKMAGFDPEDIRRVLNIASENHIALVTFDGAGGGTGHSPCKMMNEWSYPTIELEKIVYSCMKELHDQGKWLPAIAMAGGIAMEDTLYKVLALGAPYIQLAAVGRAAMAAAMSASKVGDMIKSEHIPTRYQKFGADIDSIFYDAKMLKHQFGKETSPGAMGVYSFINRLSFGLQLFMALNRKFSLKHINQRDVIPLTREARDYLKELLK